MGKWFALTAITAFIAIFHPGMNADIYIVVMLLIGAIDAGMRGKP